MVAPLPNAEQQFCNPSGVPYAGGSVTFYVPSTTTPKDTWQDQGKSVLNQNPCPLDSAGRAIIWGNGSYRAILKDQAGNTIWDQVTTTEVSDAMSPVCLAPDIATAQSLLGIDPTLPAQLATESAARIAGDNAEASARAAADTAEATTRAAGDSSLLTGLNNEVARAEAEEANLQAQITAMSGASIQGVRAGSVTSDVSGNFTVTFSSPFATKCVWAAIRLDMFGDDEAPNAHAAGFIYHTTGFTAVDMTGTGLHSATWFALGY